LDQKLNIAVVAACPFPAQRGTPVRVFRMSEALGRRGHNVHVVTYHLGESETSDQFSVHRIPQIKSYREMSAGPTYRKLFLLDPLLTIKLYQLLRANPIDVIHAHHYEGLMVSLLVTRLTGHPVVYDAHTILESELPSYSLFLPGFVKRRIGRLIDGQFPKRARHCIVVSEGIKKCLVGSYGLRDSEVTEVVNGVESTVFSDLMQVTEPARKCVKRLIYTGNFANFQGVDLLLKAFKKVVKQHSEVRLDIVSSFAFDKLESLAQSLRIRDKIDVRKVDFTQVPKLLSAADVALNPRAVCDGLPQKLLNYMAAGKPVVSFQGSAKILQHGKTGWIVENGSIDAFAQGIIKLLEDEALATQLGNNARDYVLTELTWDKAAEKVEAALTSALANKGRR
jgi:glycosyltransferase involved in cell wall biosynthesis